MENKKKVIVLFSGGVDSTAALHECFVKHQYLDVVVHHVRLVGFENRHEAEDASVRKILKWYKKHSYRFEYTEATFDSTKSIFPWDTEVAFMSAGMVAQRDHLITHYASGDRAIHGPSAEETEAIISLHASIQQDRPELKRLRVFQHTDLTYFSKQEAWDIIPDEIKEYVWTCRNPQYKINRQTLDHWCADACGECRSCQEAAGLGLSKYLILKDL